MKFEILQSVKEVDQALLTGECKRLLESSLTIFGMRCLRHGEGIAQAVFSVGGGETGTVRLESVFVPEKYRGIGLGREVIEKTAVKLAEHDVSRIIAEIPFEADGEVPSDFLLAAGFSESEDENGIISCNLAKMADDFLDEEDDDDIWEFSDIKDRKLAVACSALAEKGYFVDRRTIDPEYSFVYIRDSEVVGAMFGHHEGTDSLVIDGCFFDGIDAPDGISVLLGYEICGARDNLDDNAIITVHLEKKEYNEVVCRCFGEACEIKKVRKFEREIDNGGEK